MAEKILVVDDEEAQTALLAGFLSKKGYRVLTAQLPQKALSLLQNQTFDLLITDYRMPGMTGLDLLKAARAIDPDIAVIMITAFGTIETAVETIKTGATDFLSKPIDLNDLLRIIDNCIDKKRLICENRELKAALEQKFKVNNIISDSSLMNDVMNMVGRVAASNATVLIRGESGTGKELIAQALNYASKRKNGPFVKINCAALPESLLESELFGHVKGAFTGATFDRKGKFEEAHGGTIFLDEIGEISLTTQTKLLRILQEKECERVGSNQTIKVDVRIIAATNRNLEEAVREKLFREDLYYRLSVVPIFIPPLRDRTEDILPLVEYFIEKYSKENGVPTKSITEEVRFALLKYDYPGNIRELENIIERAVVISRKEVLTLKDLPLALSELGKEKENSSHIEMMPLEKAEQRLIRMAMDKHKGVQTRAAKELGITERVLRYKLGKQKETID